MQHLKLIENKIHNIQSIKNVLNKWRFKNQKIVFTNGCFDILHLGHIIYLSKAADLGDKLIIGLNSDSSIKKIKGNDRPYNNEATRQYLLAALSFVSAVVLFDENTPINLIENIKPDFLVKGSDYEPKNIVGYDFVTLYGGKVVCIDFVEGYSTSEIIKKIKKN